MKTIVDRIGKPALLEQTAEECTELAHACLKEARRLRGGESHSQDHARVLAGHQRGADRPAALHGDAGGGRLWC